MNEHGERPPIDATGSEEPDDASAFGDPREGAEPADPSAELDPAAPDVASGPQDGEVPLEELLSERPLEALLPLRSPWSLGGTFVAGTAMGAAEVVPGFSGGTVALVAGIYERLVVSIRQGARTLSLLVRARPKDAWRSFLLIEWPFVVLLFAGMLTTILTVAGTIEALLAERTVEMQAIFLGLVLGAAVVGSRQLRTSSPWHVLVGVVSAALFFVALGFSPGTLDDPVGLLLLLGGAIAVCAWILPGVSGSFLLLILGLYPAVIAAFAGRDLLAMALIAIGCVLGLASFSTLLNWLLARAHDWVLAALIGLMIGSVRVLWPWPTDAGFGNAELGAPEGSEVFLALALALAAFALVWMFGLASTAVQRRIERHATTRPLPPR